MVRIIFLIDSSRHLIAPSDATAKRRGGSGCEATFPAGGISPNLRSCMWEEPSSRLTFRRSGLTHYFSSGPRALTQRKAWRG